MTKSSIIALASKQLTDQLLMSSIKPHGFVVNQKMGNLRRRRHLSYLFYWISPSLYGNHWLASYFICNKQRDIFLSHAHISDCRMEGITRQCLSWVNFLFRQCPLFLPHGSQDLQSFSVKH
jgi:hypothetical protein